MKDRKNKFGIFIYFFLRIIVILIMIRQIYLKEWFLAFACFYTLVVFTFVYSLPKWSKKGLKVELPNALEITIYAFVFCAEILGEIGRYYLTIPWWDKLLHTTSGFILAGVGISIIDLLNKNKYNHFSLSPIYVTIASFCFSMTILVLWEFFEFTSDVFFKTDMQKDTFITEINSVDLNDDKINKPVKVEISSLEVNGEDWYAKYGGYLDVGLYDTMIDLLDGCIGALVFSFFGARYLKRKDEKSIVRGFIPKYDFEEKD